MISLRLNLSLKIVSRLAETVGKESMMLRFILKMFLKLLMRMNLPIRVFSWIRFKFKLSLTTSKNNLNKSLWKIIIKLRKLLVFLLHRTSLRKVTRKKKRKSKIFKGRRKKTRWKKLEYLL